MPPGNRNVSEPSKFGDQNIYIRSIGRKIGMGKLLALDLYLHGFPWKDAVLMPTAPESSLRRCSIITDLRSL
jgi:hypothetical protein